MIVKCLKHVRRVGFKIKALELEIVTVGLKETLNPKIWSLTSILIDKERDSVRINIATCIALLLGESRIKFSLRFSL